LVIHEPGVSSLELYKVIDALGRVCIFILLALILVYHFCANNSKATFYLNFQLALRPGSPESLQQLVEIARNNTTNTTSLPGFTANKEDKARQSRDKKVGYPILYVTFPWPVEGMLSLFLDKSAQLFL